ncbi:MAG: oligosaccharide flippase family protein [Victivallales bacterium]|nr:oligosaccharide flippase family protein [Victivallales bacterium]
MLFPFLRKTLFMWVLSPGYLGLNGLLYSILGMLMLAELGFGTAITCYMFKPVAEDNEELLCAYLKFFRTVYRIVGSAIFVMGLCLMPFLRHLIHGEIPEGLNLHLVFLMHLVNTAASYFLFAYRGSILGAYHRKDVLDYIRTGVSVVEFVTIALVLYLTHNYYIYALLTIMFTMLSNILLVYATRRLFPHIVPRGTLPKEEKRRVLSDVKAIFMHKVGAVFHRSFDNLAISAFLGLVAVAAYNNYHSIILAVAGIPSAICYSMMAGFGNKIYTESKERNFRLLMHANRLIICIVIWCSAMLLALYQPFMVIWTRGQSELSRHFLTPLLLVIWFYQMQSRETLRMFKNAAALWQPDRWKPVVASVANLCMNLLLINLLPEPYKLDGVILATLVADALIQMPWESYAVFSKFFNGSQARRYWAVQAGYAILAVAVTVLACGVVYGIPMDGVPGFVIKGCAAAVAAAVPLLVIFRRDVLLLWKTIRGGALSTAELS